MKSLTEVFNECCEKFENDIDAASKRFIVEAKKNNPDVTLLEVRKHLNYWSDDKKKDAVLSNKFSDKVLHPVRNFITKKMFNLTEEEAERLWARPNKGEAIDEAVASKKKLVKDKLPRATRETTNRSSKDLSEILDDMEF